MDAGLRSFLKLLRIPGLLIAALWFVEVYEVVGENDFRRWGIYPREWDGLIGIITSPFVHDDFEHLMSNSVPLFTLTAVLIFFYKRVAFPSYIIIQFITGVAVWFFARPSYHIGASGVVYGLVSFVLWSGIFRRNVKSIALALAAVVLYSGYFYGILPTKDGVSWESHLFGFFAGIFAAFLFKDIREEHEEREVYAWELEDDEGTYFLPRDVFEKTKLQRRIEAEQAQREADQWNSDRTY